MYSIDDNADIIEFDERTSKLFVLLLSQVVKEYLKGKSD